MNCHLTGIGVALPPLRIDRPQASKIAQELSCQTEKQARQLEALYRRSGVQNRGSVLLRATEHSDHDNNVSQCFFPPAQDSADRGPTTAERLRQFNALAPPLAASACERALQQAKVRPSQVTHVITVTCTGFAAPDLGISLIDDLDFPLHTQRIQVGFMGCHGSINGLRTARGILSVDPDAVVVMCCVELCSLHYQYGYDANRIVSGGLFADGAVGVVLQSSQQSNSSQHSNSSISATNPCIASTGSNLIPKTRDAMTWGIGNHGFEMSLSAAIPSLVRRELPPYLIPWLKHHDLRLGDIGAWAVHPGGSRILSSVQDALGLRAEDLECSRQILAEHGNMSSVTMPVIVQKLLERDAPRPWVMLGFGPGLVMEVALLT